MGRGVRQVGVAVAGMVLSEARRFLTGAVEGCVGPVPDSAMRSSAELVNMK